jgi:hypothetical protein
VVLEDEGCDFLGGRRFKQVQRACDVDVDKILAAVGRQMRLVQGCGVEHDRHAAHATGNKIAIRDRAKTVRERARANIDAEGLAALCLQCAHQCFAEMPGTAGH